MTTKYLPTDTLPYTIECNVCGARFQRMIDYEEHESTHDVVASVEDLDAGPSPISDQALSPDEGLSEPLVFHFGATEESPPPRAASNSPVQTDELLENVRDEAEDTAWAGRVRLPRHVRARGVKAPRGENPVQCQWRNCANSFAGPDANKDLYTHLTEHFETGQRSIACEWTGCTVKPQRDSFYMRLHIQKHAPIGGCLECSGGCGERFTTTQARTAHHKTCPDELQRRGRK